LLLILESRPEIDDPLVLQRLEGKIVNSQENSIGVILKIKAWSVSRAMNYLKYKSSPQYHFLHLKGRPPASLSHDNIAVSVESQKEGAIFHSIKVKATCPS
jgi:hypothetical protein